MARVLVTGAGGQIGSYLCEELIGDGHDVVGLTLNEPLVAGVGIARGSLADTTGIHSLVHDNGALDAIVHLAGPSSVARSWEEPLESFDAIAQTAFRLMLAVARVRGLRLVFASSAEIFGRAQAAVQDESTPLAPASPYGLAKASAHLAMKMGREEMGAPITNLIFYLGESERRATRFVFRKITRGVAAIALGRSTELVLGNVDAIRDFSHAADLASAAKLCALTAPPGDYVCASGVGHSIRHLAEAACRAAGVDAAAAIRIDPALLRAGDIPSLIGNSARLRGLGWQPRVKFEALVSAIVEHDLRSVDS